MPKEDNNRRNFVPVDEIQRSVDVFLGKYGTRINQHSDKINKYAEIAAFNAVVDLYTSVLGYEGNPINADEEYHYKLQPFGDPLKYSYFRVSSDNRSFDIFNNLSVESAHAERHFYSSDIAVVDADSVRHQSKDETNDIGIHRASYWVPNRSVQTFVEVKNLKAFPELLFSYAGLLYEIMPSIFGGSKSTARLHIAPSLVCSFGASGHADMIRRTLLDRWHINIFVSFLRHRKLTKNKDEEIRFIGNRRGRKRATKA